MQVQFVDLTTTIYVRSGLFSSSTKLRNVLDFFADRWTWEKIWINGSPVKKEDLDTDIERLGFANLQVELHR